MKLLRFIFGERSFGEQQIAKEAMSDDCFEGIKCEIESILQSQFGIDGVDITRRPNTEDTLEINVTDLDGLRRYVSQYERNVSGALENLRGSVREKIDCDLKFTYNGKLSINVRAILEDLFPEEYRADQMLVSNGSLAQLAAEAKVRREAQEAKRVSAAADAPEITP